VILVLADSRDQEARTFAALHADVQVLTPADLSHPGWISEVTKSRSGVFFAGSQRPVAVIHGVITRIHAVFPESLVMVDPADRSYIAAEMTAFLSYWLATLSCPVINRPADYCLAGPHRSPHRWRRLARRLGIAVAPASPVDSVVAVVAGRAVTGPAIRHESSVLISQAVDAVALSVAFAAGGGLVGVELTTDLQDSRIASALFAYIGKHQ
jgi:hypothetical protein